ncbi:TPA: histidine triad nucleotide-binding protein [Candidatus Collierbacteria bacterium]|uniref:Histidine triad domain protein n=1 Tax=Candidatus Collierbacteria bacterium GW2011_GWA2_42_17 TaxID=1618378 RepID=A0A0G1C0L4_9BACT|nr:MAG: Histidine triad domain protein [Candidatus Collierbacteria bacterium GW2011_GWB2_42_12]KKS43173.1 MAG: Histidine triad domain protein [Candidatus Collierbacteria bacterium GW2011_GWA2_42_17]KKS62409.1 MAG: Histidine triad domain protein [Candidatus Collierbacteria bacterium GW2011_GWD2_42_50]HAI22723.1 histidine triad nucleotide-binding protein [Candidatus Collierbacteria bacterium]HAN22853.1 histidine triad nucleotide-binding protein [Candidatus Collierbacteria bacterium]
MKFWNIVYDEIMKDKDCLFCQIGAKEAPAEVVWESGEFIAIKNKYPIAPVHVLIMPKDHVKKADVATSQSGMFWGKIMPVVFEVVALLGLDKTGYKLVNNGAGYNHFEHEHIHVMGGTKTEPGGET